VTKQMKKTKPTKKTGHGTKALQRDRAAAIAAVPVPAPPTTIDVSAQRPSAPSAPAATTPRPASPDASAGTPAQPTTPKPTGRAAVDWAAAGRKAWETRQRNLAAKNGDAAPAATPPPTPGPTPGAPKRRGARRDASADLYETRVLAAMERTADKHRDTARVMEQVGKDFGGGWICLGTDGHRMLTRRIRDGETPTVSKVHLTTPGPAPFHFPISPDVEAAMRTEGANKLPVKLTVDAKKRVLTVGPITVPLEASAKLHPIALTLEGKYLVDGLGRGGTFGYQRKADKPLFIDTDDQLRYVVMPMRNGGQ